MARNNPATVAAVPPWSQVSVTAASSGAAWIPWARAWVWVLLWALLAFEVEPSTRDTQRSEGVTSSKGNIPEAPSARGNRPRTPVLRLNLGEVTIDRLPRLPSSRAGTRLIKESSSSSSASATSGGKRSADDNNGRERSHDMPEHDYRAPFTSDPTALHPSPTEQPNLAGTVSCLGCPDGTPALVGAESESERPRPWGPWLSNQRRSPDCARDGRGHMGEVLLEPQVLDMGASRLCIPSSAEVIVQNVGRGFCSEQSFSGRDVGVDERGKGARDPGTVQLLSVTSDSPEFHPSSFRPQILPLHGQTSFQVVFLPRAIGDADAVLTVATSSGDVTYRVQARGVANPYKIQPVVESRISVGSTYTHPIMVFNPRDSLTLTIMEIYTTEGFLHLTMPEKPEQATVTRQGSGKCSRCRGSDSSASRDPGGGSEMKTPSNPPGMFVETGGLSRPAWRIPPGVEFEVIRLSFHAETPGNFQGYVHIHTDRDGLVVPVELHVSSGGVDPTPSEVDFGVLTSPSERRHASISLFNSGREPVLIVGARVSHPDPRINVGFRDGTVIAPGMGMDDAVRLVYSGGEPALGKEGRQADSSPAMGKVLIAVNHTLSELSVVEIDYRAHVLHGGVAYDWGQVSFQVGIDSALSNPDSVWPEMSETDPPRDKQNSSSYASGTEELSRGASNDSGVFRSRKEGKQHGRPSLPPVETRLLDLKNHFPVPIQLRSVTMEKCQDVFSLSMVNHPGDDDGKGSVALPQQSWTGVSLSFRRSIAEASGGLFGGYRYDGYEPGPPSLEAVHGDQSHSFGPLSPPSGSETGTGIPAGSERGVYGEGIREAIPSVSADQRTPTQKALEEFEGRNDGSWSKTGARGAGVSSSMSVSPSLPLGCVLRAETNASTHHIPVFVFDGSLHFNLLGEDEGFEEASVPDSDSGVDSSWGLSLAASAGLPRDSRFRFTTKRRRTRQSADFDSARDVDIGGASAPKVGTQTQSFPSPTRPLTVHLGVVRAGTTARRRFNVTNLNPVEVDLSSNGFGKNESSFARMRFVGVEPLESAPRSLLEIGKNVQARSDPSAAFASRNKSSSMPTPSPHELVRERIIDGEVMERETWVGNDGGLRGSGVVCSLVPGAMATFEVEARAPASEALDGAVRMEVRGLLLSTPAETVPVLVTYDAVRGGIFFHASPANVAADGIADGAGVIEEGVEVDKEEVGPAVVHLENAFPGREVVSGVSLRSTASWETRVEGMVSNGPLVRATLTRSDVPGVSLDGGVVEVGRVNYDASNSDCIGLDAWSCLAKRAETTVAHDSDLEGGDALGAWGSAGANKIDGNFLDKGKRVVLSRTFMRLVDRYHDDERAATAPDSINKGNGASPVTAVVFRCSPDGRVVSTRRGVDPRRLGCQRPQVYDPGESAAVVGVVGEGLARVYIELWRMLPEVVYAGINRFREEVTVKTTLGSPATPMSVLVSMTVPSLVVGLANDSNVAHMSFDYDDGEKLGSPSAGTKALRFPITHIGETSDIFLEIRNPAQVPISVQLVSVEEASSKVGDGARASPSSVFLGVEGFAPVILPSGGSAAVGPVRFSPDEEGVFSVHVFLRNNLTRVEPVLLEAESGRGKLSMHPLEQAATAVAQAEVSVEGAVDAMFLGSELLARRPGIGVGVGGAGCGVGGVSDVEWRDGERAVARFPVDFRSWARDPPTTDPVVKRWMLSNRGSMPLVIHGLGIGQGWRESEAGGQEVVRGWLWRWGARGGGGRESFVLRLWRWAASGMARDTCTSTSSSGRGCSGAAAAITSSLPSTAMATSAFYRCSGGGFRIAAVVGDGVGDGKERNACDGRWRPLTLQPGMEIEVTVDYTAAHCDPVNRTLDVVSSGGNASIQLVASACGGPSAVAACRSAKRALAAAAGRGRPKHKAKMEELHGGMEAVSKAVDEGRRGSDGDGDGRVGDRWGRALLLVKMAFLMSALYFACAVLRRPGGDLSPLAGWARRLQARVAGCISAGSSGSAGGFAVSVEVHASAAVVVSSPTVPATSVPAVSGTPPTGNPRAPFDGSRSWSRGKSLTSSGAPAGSLMWDASSKLDNGVSSSSRSDANPSPDGQRQSREDIPSPCLRKTENEGEIGEDCGSAEATAAAAAAAAATLRHGVATSVEKGTSPDVEGSAEGVGAAPEAGVPTKVDIESSGKAGSLSVTKNDGNRGDLVSSSAAVTAAVDLKSPGQDSRPKHQHHIARSPPGSDKGDGHRSVPSFSPPGGVVRQKAAAVASRNNTEQQAPRSHGRGATLKGSHTAGGSSGKRGGFSSNISGGGNTVGSPLRPHHQRTNSGRVSPVVAGEGGAVSRPPRGASAGHGNNNKARGSGSHHVRSNHVNRGVPHQQRGQTTFRPPPGIGRSVPNERSSASSSGVAMVVATEFLNPTALASPGASMATTAAPDNRNRQRGQLQKPKQQDSGGGDGDRRGASPGSRGTNVDSSVPPISSPTSPELMQQEQPASGGPGSYGWGVHYSNGQVPSVSSSSSNASDGVTMAESVQRPRSNASGHWVTVGKDSSNVMSGGSVSGGDGRVSPSLAPIGSNRIRAKAGGLGPGPGPVGSTRRAPPGLSPAPNQANSYRPHFAAAPSPVIAPPAPVAFSGFFSNEEAADWSDNLDAFATASAVVAGVLSAEDMHDPTAPFSFGSGGPVGPQDGLGFGAELGCAGTGGRRRMGSRLGFYMSASSARSEIRGSSEAVGGGESSTAFSAGAPSFETTEEDQRLMFGSSTDGSGVLSFMDEGDD